MTGNSNDISTLNNQVTNAILDCARDPDYESICAVLSQMNSWDFIGTTSSKWKFLISSGGRITIETTVHEPEKIDYRCEVCVLFAPEKHGLNYGNLIGEQMLLDGYLPVSLIDFTLNDGTIYQQTAFATEIDGQTFILLKIVAAQNNQTFFYQVKTPECETVKELMALPPQKLNMLPDSQLFDAELQKLKLFWQNQLKAMPAFTIPELRIVNGVKAAIIKALLCQVNGAQRYGVTRYFYEIEQKNAESFLPTTSTLVTCLVNWGMFEQAKIFLEYYLSNFVSPVGTLIHRHNGAALSEHGMILDTISHYLYITDDYGLLERYNSTIQNIATWIINKINTDSAVNQGLVAGCAEDDTRRWDPICWYSGNMWICRGLLEFSKALQASPVPQHARLAILARQAAISLKQNILLSLNNSIINNGNNCFVPPAPEWKTSFDSMTSTVFFPGSTSRLLVSSYVNYRIYPEMLSSDIMEASQSKSLLKFRREHGGEFLGLTRFKFHDSPEMLDDWPIYHQLWALLNLGDIRYFLMTLYAHMAHHQARGTFFAPEATWFDRLDSIHCMPSQLTVPLAVSWLLIFPERDRNFLHLNRGASTNWLSKTGDKISIKNALTHWGEISYQIEKTGDNNFDLNIDTNFHIAPEVMIFHLRLPDGLKIEDPPEAFDRSSDTWQFLKPKHEKIYIRIKTFYSADSKKHNPGNTAVLCQE